MHGLMNVSICISDRRISNLDQLVIHTPGHGSIVIGRRQQRCTGEMENIVAVTGGAATECDSRYVVEGRLCWFITHPFSFTVIHFPV